jgi:bifunctional non-homologous end joining protein LigD
VVAVLNRFAQVSIRRIGQPVLLVRAIIRKSEIMASMSKIRRKAGPTSPPTWIKPQLAKLVERAPDSPDWLHEMKLDGYRMHARLDAARVQILTRRGNDWTEKYPVIAKAIAGLPAQNAYLDGELCGVLPDGRTAFNLIQNATDTGEGSLVFFCSISCTWTAKA